MERTRQELCELIVAIETKNPRIDELIERIKSGFNGHTQFKYEEILRRNEEAIAGEA